MRRPQTHEQMNVIVHASDCVSDAVHAPDDTAEICVNKGAVFVIEQGLAVLGAENEVVMEREMRGRHGRDFSCFCCVAIPI